MLTKHVAVCFHINKNHEWCKQDIQNIFFVHIKVINFCLWEKLFHVNFYRLHAWDGKVRLVWIRIEMIFLLSETFTLSIGNKSF